MGMCRNCGEVVNTSLMIDKLCPDCQSPELAESKKELNQFEYLSIQEKKEKFKDMIITTECSLNIPITKRLGVVTAQRVYGMNIVKDFFSAVRDVVGGRVKNVENSIEDAKRELELEILEKAYLMQGNAIIALKIEHTYASNNMVSLFATGTVVKLLIE